jgi:hypothetical protein
VVSVLAIYPQARGTRPVECAYGPILNVVEKAGFSFGAFPKVGTYLEALRARPAWQETPKLPGL